MFFTTLRRFLVVQSLLAWQGGFFFYALFVVPTGTRVLESARLQGAITQQVSNWLNVLGIVSLVLLFWDQLTSRCVKRWLIWFVLAATLAIQFPMHGKMSQMFNTEDLTYVPDRRVFKAFHGTYLWMAAVQWLAGLFAVWFMLSAWQREGRRVS